MSPVGEFSANHEDDETSRQRLRALRGQARIDAAVELCYAGSRSLALYDLAPDEVVTALRAAAMRQDAFTWPPDVPDEDRGRWMYSADVSHLEVREFTGEDVIESLGEKLSPDRRQALLEGAAPTAEETADLRAGYIEYAMFDCGTGLHLVVAMDFLGRTITFVRQIGDWGTEVGTEGPFLDGEDRFANWRDPKDYLGTPGGEGWCGWTPEWLAAPGRIGGQDPKSALA